MIVVLLALSLRILNSWTTVTPPVDSGHYVIGRLKSCNRDTVSPPRLRGPPLQETGPNVVVTHTPGLTSSPDRRDVTPGDWGPTRPSSLRDRRRTHSPEPGLRPGGVCQTRRRSPTPTPPLPSALRTTPTLDPRPPRMGHRHEYHDSPSRTGGPPRDPRSFVHFRTGHPRRLRMGSEEGVTSVGPGSGRRESGSSGPRSEMKGTWVPRCRELR